MRLSCPNCQTEYDVPDAALTGRPRRLRCANCMTTWKAAALEMVQPEPALPAAAPVEPEAAIPEFPAEAETGMVEQIEVTPLPEPAIAAEAMEADSFEEIPVPWAPEQERVSLSKASREKPPAPEVEHSAKRGLQISVLIVLLLIVAILAEHRPIGHLWPPSLRLFNALGLR